MTWNLIEKINLKRSNVTFLRMIGPAYTYEYPFLLFSRSHLIIYHDALHLFTMVFVFCFSSFSRHRFTFSSFPTTYSALLCYSLPYISTFQLFLVIAFLRLLIDLQNCDYPVTVTVTVTLTVTVIVKSSWKFITSVRKAMTRKSWKADTENYSTGM